MAVALILLGFAFNLGPYLSKWEGTIEKMRITVDASSRDYVQSFGVDPSQVSACSWIIKCTDGRTRSVTVPADLWRRGSTGDNVIKERWQRLPDLRN